MNEKSKNSKIVLTILLILILIVIFAIVFFTQSDNKLFTSKQTLNILSGSENQVLEPILEEFEKKNNIKISMTYEGSVDIMQELQNAAQG